MIILTHEDIISNEAKTETKRSLKNVPALLAVPNVPLAEEVAVEVLNTGDALILQKAVTEGSHLTRMRKRTMQKRKLNFQDNCLTERRSLDYVESKDTKENRKKKNKTPTNNLPVYRVEVAVELVLLDHITMSRQHRCQLLRKTHRMT